MKVIYVRLIRLFSLEIGSFLSFPERRNENFYRFTVCTIKFVFIVQTISIVPVQHNSFAAVSYFFPTHLRNVTELFNLPPNHFFLFSASSLASNSFLTRLSTIPLPLIVTCFIQVFYWLLSVSY